MRTRAVVYSIPVAAAAVTAVAAVAAWTGTGLGLGAAAGKSVPSMASINFTPDVTTPGLAKLTWTAPSVGAVNTAITGYRVVRWTALSGGTSTNVCSANLTLTTLTCTDAPTPAPATYWYTVAAVFTGTGATAPGWTGTPTARKAAAVIADATPPTMSAMAILDDDDDGKLDHLSIAFSEAMSSASTTSGVTVSGLPAGGSITGTPSVSGNTVTLTIDETSEAVSTAVGTTRVTVAAASGLKDVAGNSATPFANQTPGDSAKPVLTGLLMQDTDTNGKVNRVTAGFSESLVTTAPSATPWTLTNVPSKAAGTEQPSSVTISGSTVTLNITEGSNAADTSVGSFTVALAANASGIRDAAGNQASFAATAPADAAAPVAISFADTDGAIDGQPQSGDTFTVTYSEPLVTTWSAPDSTQTLVLTNASPRDTITFPAKFGSGAAIDSGDNGYITSGTATFATTLTKPTTSSVRLTLGSCTGTGCSNLGTPALRSFTFEASATIKDAANNGAVGAATQAIRLF